LERAGDGEHVNEQAKVPNRPPNATHLIYDHHRIVKVV